MNMIRFSISHGNLDTSMLLNNAINSALDKSYVLKTIFILIKFMYWFGRYISQKLITSEFFPKMCTDLFKKIC